MFELLKTKKEMSKAMESGIVCLAETAENKNKFAFYTTDTELTSFLSKGKSAINNHDLDYDCENDLNEHITQAYNLLTQKIDDLHLDIFTGRVFSIASTNQPDLSLMQSVDQLLNLDEDFVTLDGLTATLISVNEQENNNNKAGDELVFSIAKPEHEKTVITDLFGTTPNGKLIYNDEKLQENDGYLFIAEDLDPQWLAKDKIEHTVPKGLFLFLPSIGYFKKRLPFSITLLKNAVSGE